MKKWLLWGIPILLLLGLVVWRFATRGAAQAQVAGRRGGGGTASVELATATSKTITQTVQGVGNVESPFKVEVSPKTAGRINYLTAREGDPVHVGQVLLKIDPSDLQAAVVQQQASIAEARSRLAQARITTGATDVGITSQIQQQQAGVASAQADLNQTQRNYEAQVASAQAQVQAARDAVSQQQANLRRENANLQNAQAKYNRTYSLYQQGFLAAQDLDDARTAVAVEQQAVGAIQAQVASAGSQLNVQQQNLTIAQRKGQSDIAASRAKLTQAGAQLRVAAANRSQSPAYRQNLAALQSQVDAAVAQYRQAQARLSETVVASTINGTVTARKADPGALASPGAPVLEVQFIDWLYVTTTIPIEYMTQVHSGQMAQITMDALPGRTFSGPIENINAAADPTSRQFSVRVRLDNKNHAIKPGMYARLSVVLSTVNAPTVVPREAVQTAPDSSTTVTVIDKQNMAHVLPVKTGVSDAASVQILSGVHAGDKVVILSYTPVRDGQKVAVGAPGGGGQGKGKGQRSGRGRRGSGGGTNQ